MVKISIGKMGTLLLNQFFFQANAVQCTYRGYSLLLGFAIKKQKKIYFYFGANVEMCNIPH